MRQLRACDTLTVLADSDKVGELFSVSDDGKQIFVMGTFGNMIV